MIYGGWRVESGGVCVLYFCLVRYDPRLATCAPTLGVGEDDRKAVTPPLSPWLTINTIRWSKFGEASSCIIYRRWRVEGGGWRGQIIFSLVRYDSRLATYKGTSLIRKLSPS